MEEPIEASAMNSKQTPERVSPADEGHEDDRQERSAQDEEARTIAVGEIAHAGLDDEGEYPHHADDETDLGQRKGVFLDEYRQKRADEGEIEIADEMDQRQAEDDLDVGMVRLGRRALLLLCGHLRFSPSALPRRSSCRVPLGGELFSHAGPKGKAGGEVSRRLMCCQIDLKPPQQAAGNLRSLKGTTPAVSARRRIHDDFP